jgi:hypothetical protein
MNRFRIALVATTLAVVLCGCATTKLTSSWRDPQYQNGPVKKIMVVGISTQTSVRRIFEDTFAEILRANGVEAVPSHTLIVEDGQIAEERMRAAVEQAGADSVLITRMVERKTEVLITPAEPMLPTYGMMRHGYYGYYSGAWMGYYEPATVQHYHYIVAETTLFITDSPKPVWSGTTRTVESEDIRTASEGFAEPMIAALKKEGLI